MYRWLSIGIPLTVIVGLLWLLVSITTAWDVQAQSGDSTVYLPLIPQPQADLPQAEVNPGAEATATVVSAPVDAPVEEPVAEPDMGAPDWGTPESSAPQADLQVIVAGENLAEAEMVAMNSADEVLIQVDAAIQEGVSAMQTGATHTQYSLDRWGNNEAVARGKSLMQEAATFQNQHIMGWGANNPMPAPGVYEWGSLDARVQTMRESGATMVITLCCAPGWMRPAGYEADWTYMEVAPDPARLQEFVNLTVAVAQRYPDVRYFQVWNEFKGMWSTAPGCTPTACGKNRWDYERYTTLYNAVYDGIKAVRPDALIGGPYIVMSTYSAPKSYTGTISGAYGYMDQRVLDAISYWLANKRGADFIALDASTRNKDGIWLTDEFSQAQKLTDVVAWLRQQPHGAATLPLFWAEWYASVQNSDGDLYHYNAVMANALIYTLRAGSMLPLMWQPQGDVNGYAIPAALFSDTRVVGGGQATPFQATMRAFREHFAPGTPLVRMAISMPERVIGLASPSKTLLVNKTNAGLAVRVNDEPLVLAAYEVKVLDTPPQFAPLSLPTATPTATATDTAIPTLTPVDTTKPVVALTNPLDGSVVLSGSTVELAATATDNVGVTKVEFWVNGVNKCRDFVAPYSCAWSVPTTANASYRITAKAFDAAGNDFSRVVDVAGR